MFACTLLLPKNPFVKPMPPNGVTQCIITMENLYAFPKQNPVEIKKKPNLTERFFCKKGKFSLSMKCENALNTLSANPLNGPLHSNNSPVFTDEFFEYV